MTQQSRSTVSGFRRDDAEVHPPYLYPDYKGTRLRAPEKPLIILPHTLTEMTGPVYGHERVGPLDHDLTRQHKGEPFGERIIVRGRVLDGDGRPVRNSLVEIWQANAAGRYIHQGDRHPAPLDPNFSGAGRCLTDAEGRFEFLTVKPGRPRPQRPAAGTAHRSRDLRARAAQAARHKDLLPRRGGGERS
jgi:protocatechuate 3,4-dioxygenase, beta subunit